MAEANGTGAGAVAAAPGGAPSLNALVQFTKDFSFENPNAPRSLGPQEKAPNISIQVNVNAKQLAETEFEARAPTRCSSSSSTTPASSACRTSRRSSATPS